LTARPRVLQVGKFYAPARGGIETCLKYQSEALLNHVDLKVIVANGERSTSREVINGVPVTRLPTWATLSSAPVCPGMVREIRAARADIVHLHLPNPAAVLAYLASGYSGTLILHYHSDIVRQKWTSKAFQPIMDRVLQRADSIIVASRNYARSSPVLRPMQDRCDVIPYGIVMADFERPNHARVRAIRDRFGPNLAIAVGRLVYYKGFEYLIRAMAHVDGTLLLVGKGPMHDSLAEEIRKHGLTNKVHLLGEVDGEKRLDLYHAADLMVLPSVARSEAFGIVQLEAMACGKPVINTNLDSGVPFVSIDGVTGLTVPPQDEASLASAMRLLFENEALRQKYGDAARHRVQEQFTVDTMVEQLLNVYARSNAKFAALVRS
jgi:glycosyltransferase involved in cell wall biosynthesis